MDIGGCQRLHVHLPLRHQRMGRTVSARSQRVLRQRGHLDRINQRPARNSRNRTFGLVLRQTLQGRPKAPRPVIRHTEFRRTDIVPVRRYRGVGECAGDGTLRNRHRRTDLFPRRSDGRGHRPPQGYRRRIGRRGSSILLRRRHSGRSLRMAHRRTHNRRRRRHESL